MPLPDRDFDTTESAVPWKKLTEAGHSVVFAFAVWVSPLGSRYSISIVSVLMRVTAGSLSLSACRPPLSSSVSATSPTGTP